MNTITYCAGCIALMVAATSLPVLADDMDDSMDNMDDVTIRIVDEHDNSSAKILSLPEQAADQARMRADSREGYGLSKARDMHAEHRNPGAKGDGGDDMGAMSTDETSKETSVDGLAEAISVANEHAKEALQNAMDARDMRNDAKAEHGNSGMGGMNGNGHKP